MILNTKIRFFISGFHGQKVFVMAIKVYCTGPSDGNQLTKLVWLTRFFQVFGDGFLSLNNRLTGFRGIFFLFSAKFLRFFVYNAWSGPVWSTPSISIQFRSDALKMSIGIVQKIKRLSNA